MRPRTKPAVKPSWKHRHGLRVVVVDRQRTDYGPEDNPECRLAMSCVCSYYALCYHKTTNLAKIKNGSRDKNTDAAQEIQDVRYSQSSAAGARFPRALSSAARRRSAAASSGRIAPLAMLCLPTWSLTERKLDMSLALLLGSFSVASKSWRHSSSVAGYPSRTEKNLCRTTVLMRSNA